MGILFNHDATCVLDTPFEKPFPLAKLLTPGSRVTVTIPKPGETPLRLCAAIDTVSPAFEQTYEATLNFVWNYGR